MLSLWCWIFRWMGVGFLLQFGGAKGEFVPGGKEGS